MDLYSFPPVAAVLDFAYSLVSALADALTPLAGASAAAAAIVLVTLLVRAALIPVGISQAKAESTRRRLAPQLRELKRKYATDPQLLQRKTLELYSAENASPLAGCLPALAQAPVLSTVYALFILASVNGHSNALLGEHLAGTRLGTSFVHFVGSPDGPWQGYAVFAVLLFALSASAIATRRRMLRIDPNDAARPSGAAGAAGRMLAWMPFMTVAFAAIVPLAATLYLAVSATWTLAERSILRKFIN